MDMEDEAAAGSWEHILFQTEVLPSGQLLVGGLELFLFFYISGIIIPTDFHIFQRGWNHQSD